MKPTFVYAVFQTTPAYDAPSELMDLFKVESTAEAFARQLRLDNPNDPADFVQVVPWEVR